jgi:hypothetical protein
MMMHLEVETMQQQPIPLEGPVRMHLHRQLRKMRLREEMLQLMMLLLVIILAGPILVGTLAETMLRLTTGQ